MEYKHFSHEHNLNLYRVQAGQQFRCHGCQMMCNDSIYACWRCNFFLHEHCGNANRYVKHPSHQLHPLVLVPSPTYCSGSFLCTGCGAPGNSFSYCCPPCEVDLHVHCTYLPPNVNHKAHQHELIINFTTGEQAGNLDQHCKICTKQLNSKNWSYICSRGECDFRVHTYCATSEVKPGLYQDDEPDTQIPAQNPNSSTGAGGNQPQKTGLTPEEALAEVMQMQLQMQMAQEFAQMMASFNLSHLAPWHGPTFHVLIPVLLCFSLKKN